MLYLMTLLIKETYHKFFEFVHEDPKEWNVILKNDNLEILKKQVFF